MNSQLDIFAAKKRRCIEEDAKRVWKYLCNYKGKKNTVTTQHLINLTGLDMRRIRAAVKYLIEERGKAVCSCKGSNPGYFVGETDEEIRQSAEPLRKLGLSTLKKYSRLRKIGKNKLIEEIQMDLGN